MPRRHGNRTSAPPISGPRYACIGCDRPVSWSRLCCPSCWGRLASAPGGLRDRLSVPDGFNPRLYRAPGFRAAVAEAGAFLDRVRRGGSGDAR